MWPVIVDVVAAVAAGGLVTLIVRRWPHAPVGAPQVAPSTIRTEVHRHDRLAQVLRARVDPQATTGLALTVAGAVVVLGGVAVGLLLFMVRRNLGFAEWDLSAARFGAQHATSASTAILRDISLLGGTLGLIVVVLIVLVVEQRRIPNHAAIGFLLVVVVGQNLLANGIKVLVDRAPPRPPPAHRLRQLVLPVRPRDGRGGDVRRHRAAPEPPPLAGHPSPPGGRGRGHRRRRRRQPGAARRALADRRDGGARARLGLVRRVLHRLRWPLDALRRPGRRGRARGGGAGRRGPVPSAPASP